MSIEHNPQSDSDPQANQTEETQKHLDLVRFQQTAPDTMVVAAPHEEAVSAVREQLGELRTELVEGLESREEGLHIERARDFLRSMGLRADAEILVLDDNDFEEFSARWEQSFGGFHDAEGAYTPGANVIAVHRNQELEEQFGPDIIEYMLVHELAHASPEQEVYSYTVSGNQEDITVRAGLGRTGQTFTSPSDPDTIRGGYIEEAFADVIAQLYARNVLHREHGFALSDEPGIVQTPGGPIELPADYLLGEHAGKQAVASLGLHFLLEQNPTLMDSLVKARREPRGLQEVATKIGQLGRKAGQPDLYRQMTMTNYDAASFTAMTRTIVDLLSPATAAQWDEEYSDLEEFIAVDEDDEHQQGTIKQPTPEETAAMRAMYEQYTKKDSRPPEVRLQQATSRIASLERDATGRELTSYEQIIMADSIRQRDRAQAELKDGDQRAA